MRVFGLTTRAGTHLPEGSKWRAAARTWLASSVRSAYRRLEAERMLGVGTLRNESTSGPSCVQMLICGYRRSLSMI